MGQEKRGPAHKAPAENLSITWDFLFPAEKKKRNRQERKGRQDPELNAGVKRFGAKRVTVLFN
jgi:hypothetical protein